MLTSGIEDKKEVKHLIVQKVDDGKRLDVFLAKDTHIPSRSFAQNLISLGLVQVEGRVVTKHYHVKEGEKIVLQIPPPKDLEVSPEPIKLDIHYEDEDLIVLSKPAGMVVHPAHGHITGTLVNALLFHTKKLSGIGGVRRPGIVHRLDKNTSGLMIVAKNDKSHLALSEQLKKREIKRSYLALVHGVWKVDSGTIDAPIGRGFKDRKKMAIAGKASRKAVTNFNVLKRFKNYTLLEVQLDTGRTHQIRVHMAYAKHHVVGDREYGVRKDRLSLQTPEQRLDLKRQFLHAYRLEFKHPRTGKTLVFEDKLPEELQNVLKRLEAEQL